MSDMFTLPEYYAGALKKLTGGLHISEAQIVSSEEGKWSADKLGLHHPPYIGMLAVALT